MTGQRGAGTPHGTTPTHRTDQPGTWWRLLLWTAGSVAVAAVILGAIPYACGAWT